MDEYLSFLVYSYFRSPFLDFLSLNISIFLSTTLLAAYLFVYWFLKNDRKGFFLFSSFLLNNALVFFLKAVFARERPLYGVFEPLYAFPSAHAANAFFLAAVLTNYSKKNWWFYLVATLVAFSRVYNGSHYIFDVLAGAAVGYFFAVVCLKYRESFDKLYNYVESKFSL